MCDYVRFCRLVLGALQNCLQLISHDIFFMQKKLVEVVTTHYYLLHEDGTHFTPLAQVCSVISIIMCPLQSIGSQRLLRQDSLNWEREMIVNF